MIDRERELDDLLDVAKVADILHVSTKTVNRLIGYGRGELSAVRVGSRWKVRGSDLKEYLQKRGGAFGGDQTLEIIMSGVRQNDSKKNDLMDLDLKKKYLELADTAFEVATKMVNSFYPEVDAEKRASLTLKAIHDFLEVRNLQELDLAILKIPFASRE